MRLVETTSNVCVLLMTIFMIVKIGALVIGLWRIAQKRPILRLAPCVVLYVIGHVMRAGVLVTFRHNRENKTHKYPISLFYDMPVWVVVAIAIVLFIWLVAVFIVSYRWRVSNITAMSINESINNLPNGICCYNDAGRTFLVNNLMSKLSFELTGKALVNGNTFVEKLPLEMVGEDTVVKTKDGRVYSFLFSTIKYQRRQLNEVIAVDITNEYDKIQKLEQDRRQMTELNHRLRAYSKTVAEVNIEKEILAAKVRIHDELGHALIVAKRYMIEEAGDKEALLALWKRNIVLLRDEQAENENDDYENVFYIAKCAGVKLVVRGNLPKQEAAQAITATAISECLTNVCRHAHGNEIVISIEDNENTISMQFTNNGKQPEEPIVEGGGLLGLRKLVEHESGTMVIESIPRFKLNITLNS